jgi:hypothetical protein
LYSLPRPVELHSAQSSLLQDEGDSQLLNEMAVDEHATDFLIGILDEKMMKGGEVDAQDDSKFRAMKQREPPPDQPPPMPELSSAATVLEGQGYSVARFSDQNSYEHPPPAPAHPDSATTRPDLGVHREKAAAELKSAATPGMLAEEEIMHLPTGQAEMTSMSFCTACAVAFCILGAARLGQNEEQREARGGGRALQLLQKRQRENFAANQILTEDGKTSEQRIQEARLKVCTFNLFQVYASASESTFKCYSIWQRPAPYA